MGGRIWEGGREDLAVTVMGKGREGKRREGMGGGGEKGREGKNVRCKDINCNVCKGH